MVKFKQIVAAAASIAILAGTAVPANAGVDYASAEKLRKLDIMLMVTALRCRHGADNFQADYEKFSRNQYGTMQAAAGTLQSKYAAKMGSKAAKRELDKISVSMANRYGQGHPWLECAELKEVTQGLAAEKDGGRLLAAADQLLANSRPSQFAMAH